jgi:tetratricopeptide (TPR) repeat protein
MPSRGLVNVVHAAGTDHRILRSADAPAWENPNEPPTPRAPLIAFHQDRARGDPDAHRDLALALTKMADRLADTDPASAATLAGLALPKLRVAARDDPTDVVALEGRAHALWKLNQLRDALAGYAVALKQAPERESCLRGAVRLALKLAKLDEALTYGQRLVRVNPWSAENYSSLAQAHFARNETSEGLAAVRKALQFNPTQIEARSLLVTYHLRRGEEEAARREFELTVTLNPGQRDALRAWFESMRPGSSWSLQPFSQSPRE